MRVMVHRFVSFAASGIFHVVCVRNFIAPKLLEVVLLVLVCVCLFWGCWCKKEPREIGLFAGGGAFKSHCLGALKGPNTNFPNFVFTIFAEIPQILCRALPNSHSISAYSSQISKGIRCSRFWGLREFAPNYSVLVRESSDVWCSCFCCLFS